MTHEQDSNPFKILFAELTTGHVFRTDLEKYNGEGETFTYFASFDNALSYGDTILSKRPDLEYVIYSLDKPILYKSINETTELPRKSKTTEC
jgi:hypothetical protein